MKRKHYQKVVSGHLSDGISEFTQALDDLSKVGWRVDHVMLLLPDDGGRQKFLIVYSEERG